MLYRDAEIQHWREVDTILQLCQLAFPGASNRQLRNPTRSVVQRNSKNVPVEAQERSILDQDKFKGTFFSGNINVLVYVTLRIGLCATTTLWSTPGVLRCTGRLGAYHENRWSPEEL